MWFQLFQAVTGERKYKQSAFCQTWDVTGLRSDWKGHRSCRRNNRQLRHTAGKAIQPGKTTVEEVAEKRQASVEEVISWLSKTKNKP